MQITREMLKEKGKDRKEKGILKSTPNESSRIVKIKSWYNSSSIGASILKYNKLKEGVLKEIMKKQSKDIVQIALGYAFHSSSRPKHICPRVFHILLMII